MKILQRFGAMLALLTLSTTLPAAASITKVFSGKVVHVSTDNLKVTGAGQTMSFLVVPHFDQIFSDHDKTTYQMRSVHAGMFVRVYYDQRAFGARHADRIILLNAYGRGVKKVGS